MAKSDKKLKLFILIIAILISLSISFLLIGGRINGVIGQIDYMKASDRELSEDEILRISKSDERGKIIESIPSYEEGTTWAIYFYIVASDLESGNIDNLSPFTKMIVEEEKDRISDENKEFKRGLISRFMEESSELKTDLPQYFYLPEQMKVEEDESSSMGYSYDGSAMKNLNDLFSVSLPENVKVIIQTGGANAFSEAIINPNKSERFIYDSSGFRRLESNTIVNMSEVESIASFLSFCKENYDADHTMLIFWNHGAGPFGYGKDEIYGDLASIEDLKDALSLAYGDNSTLDIIGFDACLMANIEVCNSLYPYAKYLLASEELEPGDGWDYSAISSAFNSNPYISAEMLGKSIIDGFASYYAKEEAEQALFSKADDTTLSLVDMKKAKECYDAYEDLMETILLDSTKDLAVLARVSSASSRSLIFGQSYYDIVNLLDIGSFMTNIAEYYPEEANRVIEKLNEAVLYARGTSYGNNATGLTVYFPTYLRKTRAIRDFLNYIYNISDSDAINTLYFYKLMGDLREDQREYLKTLGVDDIQIFNSDSLTQLSSSEVLIDDLDLSIELTDEQMRLIQHGSLYLWSLDGGMVRALGYGENVSLDENMASISFDGSWIKLRGEEIETEIISSIDGITKYKSPIIHNGARSSLIFSLDRESGEVSVDGVIKEDYSESESLTVERIEPIKVGDSITPLYVIYALGDNSIASETAGGRRIRYKGPEDFEYSPLSNGDYMLMIELFDFRGDSYYSPVITFNMDRGVVKDFIVDPEFLVVTVGD